MVITTMDYELRFEQGTISARWRGDWVLQELTPVLLRDGKPVALEACSLRASRMEHVSFNAYEAVQRRLALEFSAPGLQELTVLLELGSAFARIRAEGADLFWRGTVRWGRNMEEDTFAVSPAQDAPFLRGTVGPAADRNDTALLDRQTGYLLKFAPETGPGLSFDYDRSVYWVESCGSVLEWSVETDFYQKQYGVTYAPMSRKRCLQGPSASFNTYYPWLFDYDEADLLEEVTLLQAQLGDFGLNSVVVDLEWVRTDTWGSKDFPGDHFTPDQTRFPGGMAALAAKIREAGFVPHLWIGVTCDPRCNGEMEAHPDLILADEPDSWCGRYFLDPTHPYAEETYLPRFFRQVRQWGFRAIKWDLLCETYDVLEAHHEKLHDPTGTTPEILRKLLARGRELMGEDCYFCQCAAPGQEELRLGAGLMDSVRIGRDLWSWENFREQMLWKLCSHYPLHNILFHCDPDNLILADRRTTAADTCLFDSRIRLDTRTDLDEAISRLTPVVLLGQCFNIGDDLRTLTADRLDLLRRGLPVAQVRPGNLGFTRRQDVMPMQVRISRPFEAWTVFALANTREEPVEQIVTLRELGLEPGDWFRYDYWTDRVELCRESFPVSLRPRQTVTYGLRRRTGIPQLVGSSRHLLQGAVELEQVRWEPESTTLVIAARCVKGYPYTLTLFVPEGYGCELPAEPRPDLGGTLCRLTIPGEKTGRETLRISFSA